MKLNFSPRTRLVGLVVALYFGLLLFFRAVFLAVFAKEVNGDHLGELLKEVLLGIKFDFRLATALGVLAALLSLPKFLNPQAVRSRSWYQRILVGLGVILFVTFMVDLGYFSYLHTRINATVFDFLKNPLVSGEMVWETYPLGWAGFFLILFVWLFNKVVQWVVRQVNWTRGQVGPTRNSAILMALILALGMYGKLSFYPLRWSDAYFSADSYVCAFGLNPVLNLVDTFKNRTKNFDSEEVRKHYDLMANYLGVVNKDSRTLNFSRVNQALVSEQKPMNVVIFVMESFAAYKTGVMNHPLNPTPYFDELVKEGLLYDRYYVPSEGTARSVFGLVTGIPDVNPFQTASRNPLIVEQNTVINSFEGYEKYYFLGGSASWGEIRGVFAHNVPGIHIFEEGSYKSKRTDVWGISDLALFEEAHENLAKVTDKPFVAVIQSAGFHRPYTIPEDKRGFELRKDLESEVLQTGFISLAEFNSLRFADHSLGHFFKLAKQSPYFENTLFVIVGDHGLPDRSAKHVVEGLKEHGIERFHVPLLFYSPKHIPAGRSHDIATEMDVLPSAAGFLGKKFVNTTLGRDLFHLPKEAKRVAFTYVYHEDPQTMGVLDGEFYFKRRAGRDLGLYRYMTEDYNKDVSSQFPEKAAELKAYTEGFYETARYMLYHNPNMALHPEKKEGGEGCNCAANLLPKQDKKN